MKFRFNEEVRITKGFYIGCMGKVRSYHHFLWFFKRYKIEVPQIYNKIVIKEDHLTSLTYPNKDFDKKLKKVINK